MHKTRHQTMFGLKAALIAVLINILTNTKLLHDDIHKILIK